MSFPGLIDGRVTILPLADRWQSSNVLPMSDRWQSDNVLPRAGRRQSDTKSNKWKRTGQSDISHSLTTAVEGKVT